MPGFTVSNPYDSVVLNTTQDNKFVFSSNGSRIKSNGDPIAQAFMARFLIFLAFWWGKVEVHYTQKTRPRFSHKKVPKSESKPELMSLKMLLNLLSGERNKRHPTGLKETDIEKIVFVYFDDIGGFEVHVAPTDGIYWGVSYGENVVGIVTKKQLVKASGFTSAKVINITLG